jgi:hypothetical protein
MKIETLRDLLIFIMKNRTPSNVLVGWDGENTQFSVYGEVTYAENCTIETVQQDFIVIKAIGQEVLRVLPIASIKDIRLHQDFLKGQ